MNERGLNWFAWDGHTDLVLPHSLRGAWEGGQPPSSGRVVTAGFKCDPDEPATDYDRACSLEAPIGPIPVGTGEALVITNAPLLAWVPDGKAGAFVVAVAWGNVTDDVVLKLAERSRSAVEDRGVIFKTSDTLLHVLAAADTFGNPYGSGHFSIAVEPGQYRIRTHEYDEGGEGHFLVHQLDWVGDV
jgi:hypothetical protein